MNDSFKEMARELRDPHTWEDTLDHAMGINFADRLEKLSAASVQVTAIAWRFEYDHGNVSSWHDGNPPESAVESGIPIRKAYDRPQGEDHGR